SQFAESPRVRLVAFLPGTIPFLVQTLDITASVGGNRLPRRSRRDRHARGPRAWLAGEMVVATLCVHHLPSGLFKEEMIMRWFTLILVAAFGLPSVVHADSELLQLQQD